MAISASDSTDASSESEDGTITLSVATFNEFGYEELIEEYNAMQDDVVVEQKKAGTANEHQDNLYTKLAAGSGLSDIEAIEVDWLAALMEESDAFVDLSDPEAPLLWVRYNETRNRYKERKLRLDCGVELGPFTLAKKLSESEYSRAHRQ